MPQHKLLLLTVALSLLALGVASAAAADATTQPASHEAILEDCFSQMLDPKARVSPWSNIDTFTQLKKQHGITDKETAAAVLKFVATHISAGEATLLPAMTAIYSAEPAALAEVWIAAVDSKDKDTRTAAVTMLDKLEYLPYGDTSLKCYEGLLQGKPGEFPPAVVKYMYDRNANAAFVMLARHTEDMSTPQLKKDTYARHAELVLAEHMIEQAQWYSRNTATEGRDEAVKTARIYLGKLADAPEWWVRLYAAKIALSAALGDEAVIKKLKDDQNPIVSGAFKPAKPDGP